MSSSPNTGHRNRDRRLPLDGVPDLSRYDAVLAAIPAALLLASLVAAALPVSFRAAVAPGAAVSALLVADALYLNPPSTGSGPDRDPTSGPD